MFKKSIILSSVFLLASLHADPSIPSPAIEHTVSLPIEEARKTVELHTQNDPEALKLFDQITQQWLAYQKTNPSFDLDMLLNAINFAAIHHDNNPCCMIDALQAAENLWTLGNIRSVDTLVAALVQNTHASRELIADQFGTTVEQTVFQLASNKTLPEDLQTADAISLSPDTQLILISNTLQDTTTQTKAEKEHLVQVLSDLNQQLAAAALAHIQASK